MRTLAAFSRRGWWRRPPFLPNPDRAYVRWRMLTAYGDPDGSPSPDELVAYLRWRRRQRVSPAARRA
ncbi:MAG: hypothetical protein PVI35_04000 [Acidimicrobiia bacterium]